MTSPVPTGDTPPQMTKLAHIVADLERLPPAKLSRAASYVHRLAGGSRRPDRRRALATTAGCLTATQAAALEKSIDEHCERIDHASWPCSR